MLYTHDVASPPPHWLRRHVSNDARTRAHLQSARTGYTRRGWKYARFASQEALVQFPPRSTCTSTLTFVFEGINLLCLQEVPLEI